MVIFLLKLIWSVKTTCRGNSISARSVRMLKTPMLSQNEDLRKLAMLRVGRQARAYQMKTLMFRSYKSPWIDAPT